MRRAVVLLSGLVLVLAAGGQALAKDKRTFEEKQAAKEQAQQLKAQKKEASGDHTPSIRFHPSGHPSADLSWLHPKRQKGN
jgi:hypothetical protein